MEKLIREFVAVAMGHIYGKKPDSARIQVQETRKEFEGDFTVVVFPLLSLTGQAPDITAKRIGEYLVDNFDLLSGYNVIKGFLNLSLTPVAWYESFLQLSGGKDLNSKSAQTDSPPVVIEYSSPNTNKPLHLGHVRNNLVGFSLSRILEAAGNRVVMTNIVNDRGIHICKSMLAWQLWGGGETPDNPPRKGDQLVGKYYVMFETEYRKEIAKLRMQGLTEEEAVSGSELMDRARDMLRKWEAGDPDTVSLWKEMNSWVYSGFDKTYRDMGVRFDKIYYESDTYKRGRQIVLEALERGIVYRKEDNSVWVDLTAEGLDHKLLLRGDGTAVYMTQDLGTAVIRYEEYRFSRHIYVVGNEQNYHFQVLKALLKKLGYEWADSLHHFSYGMVELPEGKMKSREGTVVDADDLILGMKETAREMSEELGKLGEFPNEVKEDIYMKIGLGALKYFILKVDPKKNMLFNPEESIDFNGNTGPFIQYTYARIRSILRKAGDIPAMPSQEPGINEREREIIRILARFSQVVKDAAETLSPALIANYCYELVRLYNQFYHDYSILGEENQDLRSFRIALSALTGEVVGTGMGLLGIEMPEKM
ncbi:MAG: arginine--tRNA ligase [Bacteroidales bacterium]|nr:arginine--tRNA ligase [Bacteroidales bacterium]